MAGIIEQYSMEIEQMKRELSSAQIEVKILKERKRAARPTARGRIASDNWNARLGEAKYDLQITQVSCKVALLKNQIKLRQQAIKEEKAVAKKNNKSKK